MFNKKGVLKMILAMIGIDIGANGAAVFMDYTGNVLDVLEFSKATEHDISNTFAEWFSTAISLESKVMAYVEKVHAMPKQGVSSVFTFGESFGFIRGLLTAHKISYELVTPQKWQKAMQCESKGNKNITKAAAQRLFPDRKITHATADALLIAEYGRRINIK
jgi:crossover junction endodeoxyribonuclease RuvC